MPGKPLLDECELKLKNNNEIFLIKLELLEGLLVLKFLVVKLLKMLGIGNVILEMIEDIKNVLRERGGYYLERIIMCGNLILVIGEIFVLKELVSKIIVQMVL